MKRTVFILAAALFAQGCLEPDDVSPTIEVLSITPVPTTGMVCGQLLENVSSLNSSDTLKITFQLTDDQELSQYKIELHNNFACHGHSGKVETVDWYVISIEDVNGSQQTVTRTFPVPQNVTTGNYHFHVFATDAVGNNAATAAIYSLNVTNTSDSVPPTLTVTEPSNSNFSVQKGDVINFQGTLSDNEPLGTGGNGKIEILYRSTSSPNTNELYLLEFDSSTTETYNFEFDAIVPVTAVSGSYIFELRAFDGINNPSNTFEYMVEIL